MVSEKEFRTVKYVKKSALVSGISAKKFNVEKEVSAQLPDYKDDDILIATVRINSPLTVERIQPLNTESLLSLSKC